MNRRTFYLATLVVTLGGHGQAQARPECQVVPKSLAAMRDCYRPLLVFSPSPNDARLKRQAALLDEAADDMMDRFVLFTPIAPEEERINRPLDAPYTVMGAHELSLVRERFHIPANEFAVLLLDEDGSLKLRSAAPVSADRLNTLIDRTPRRQAEMQRPHAN